jgi:hypothetical protein
MESSSKYPLERTWSIWEQWNQNEKITGNFMENMQEIGSFKDLFEFWQHWKFLPHADPTKLFYSRSESMKRVILNLRQDTSAHIDGIGVFQKGIQPAWEDEQNRCGSDIMIRKEFDWSSLKELWTRLVCAVIGETIPYSEIVAGCRIVDKYNILKFEIWLKEDLNHPQLQSKRSEIEGKIRELVFYDQELGDFTINSHQSVHSKRS